MYITHIHTHIHTSHITPPPEHMSEHTSHPSAKQSSNKLISKLKIGGHVTLAQPLPASHALHGKRVCHV